MTRYVYTGNPRSMRRRFSGLKTTKATPKRKFKCVNGPLEGQSLWLTDGLTAEFTISGHKGQYKNGEWYASS